MRYISIEVRLAAETSAGESAFVEALQTLLEQSPYEDYTLQVLNMDINANTITDEQTIIHKPPLQDTPFVPGARVRVNAALNPALVGQTGTVSVNHGYDPDYDSELLVVRLDDETTVLLDAIQADYIDTVRNPRDEP